MTLETMRPRKGDTVVITKKTKGQHKRRPYATEVHTVYNNNRVRVTSGDVWNIRPMVPANEHGVQTFEATE